MQLGFYKIPHMQAAELQIPTRAGTGGGWRLKSAQGKQSLASFTRGKTCPEAPSALALSRFAPLVLRGYPGTSSHPKLVHGHPQCQENHQPGESIGWQEDSGRNEDKQLELLCSYCTFKKRAGSTVKGLKREIKSNNTKSYYKLPGELHGRSRPFESIAGPGDAPGKALEPPRLEMPSWRTNVPGGDTPTGLAPPVSHRKPGWALHPRTRERPRSAGRDRRCFGRGRWQSERDHEHKEGVY